VRHRKGVCVDALASATVAGDHQALDRVLYLTAAMTGLRQGELIAPFDNAHSPEEHHEHRYVGAEK
jgi:hypothetical protein